MDYRLLIDYLKESKTKYLEYADTSALVTMRIGGKAKLVVFPPTIKEFIKILSLIENEKYVIIGNGSNTIFTSNYYDGIVLVTTFLNNAYTQGNFLISQCGASISRCCRLAYKMSLSGLEFAYGIPGTVGGGVYMNAAAFGFAFDSIVYESTVYDKNNSKIMNLSKKEHLLEPKKSIFMDNELVLLETKLLLENCDSQLIRQKMKTNFSRRKDTQPLDFPSCGSTFKRPLNSYASLLIDKSGLKGKAVGGAMVSTKHAGFIVNVNNATSQDVLALASIIKDTVYEKYNVILEEEFVYIE